MSRHLHHAAQINLDRVKQVTFSQVCSPTPLFMNEIVTDWELRTQDAAKVGGHTLHVMRLKGDAGAVILSIMLQYDTSKGPGMYHDGSVAAFEGVMQKYGAEWNL